MKYTKAVIHNYKSYHGFPVNVNIKENSRIACSAVMPDVDSAKAWLDRVFPGITVKIINHN